MNKQNRVALIYHDDGPSRPCGQSMATTCPHTYIEIFNTEDEAREWFKTKSFRGGKRHFIDMCFEDMRASNGSNTLTFHC